MPLHTVECFKADKLPASKIGEFERQLKGQQDGLNRLTIEEFLENIANPVKRNPAIAQTARRELQDKLQIRIQKELLAEMSPLEASKMSVIKAKETMASLAALHNPDLSAGGKDAISDFGDRRVNSSIGAQWRTKIVNLKKAAESAPKLSNEPIYMNIKLHKC